MAVGVHLYNSRGVVGISKVQPEVEELPPVRDLNYLLPMGEDGRTRDATLAQAVDAPVVVIGFLETFNLGHGALRKERVVFVCGLEELVVGPGEDVVVYPMELVRRVVVNDGLACGAEHELAPVL